MRWKAFFSNPSNMTLTFDLLIPKCIRHIFDLLGVCGWSFMMIHNDTCRCIKLKKADMHPKTIFSNQCTMNLTFELFTLKSIYCIGKTLNDGDFVFEVSWQKVTRQWLGRDFLTMGHFQFFSMILKFSMGPFLSFYTDVDGQFSKLMGLWRMAPCLPNHWLGATSGNHCPIETYISVRGGNLYKLSQKITSWVLLGSIDTKINQNISKCEITCTSYFSSSIVKNRGIDALSFQLSTVDFITQDGHCLWEVYKIMRSNRGNIK